MDVSGEGIHCSKSYTARYFCFSFITIEFVFHLQQFMSQCDNHSEQHSTVQVFPSLVLMPTLSKHVLSSYGRMNQFINYGKQCVSNVCSQALWDTEVPLLKRQCPAYVWQRQGKLSLIRERVKKNCYILTATSFV